MNILVMGIEMGKGGSRERKTNFNRSKTIIETKNRENSKS